jgi:hypothetical protein
VPPFIEEIFFFILFLIQNSSDAIYLARHVGLRVGIPKETSALTVNRLCGSGFQSIVSGCQVWADIIQFFEHMLIVIGRSKTVKKNQ